MFSHLAVVGYCSSQSTKSSLNAIYFFYITCRSLMLNLYVSDNRHDNRLRRHHTADLARQNRCFLFLCFRNFLLCTPCGTCCYLPVLKRLLLHMYSGFKTPAIKWQLLDFCVTNCYFLSKLNTCRLHVHTCSLVNSQIFHFTWWTYLFAVFQSTIHIVDAFGIS